MSNRTKRKRLERAFHLTPREARLLLRENLNILILAQLAAFTISLKKLSNELRGIEK